MASFEPIRDKDGKIVRYRIVVSYGYEKNGKKKRVKKTWTPEPGMTKKQIEKTLTKMALEIEENLDRGIVYSKEYTFAEYADYVIGLKEADKGKRKTTDRYRTLLPRINAAIGHLKLKDITPRHLNLFYQNLQEEGIRDEPEKASPKIDIRAWLKENHFSIAKFARETGIPENTMKRALNGKNVLRSNADAIAKGMGKPVEEVFDIIKDTSPLSGNTILAHHRLISLILSQAEKELLVTYNAASKASPPKVASKEAEHYEPETVREILRQINLCASLKWRTMTYLLMDTGCRRGEAAGIKWSYLDLDAGLITFARTLLYSSNSGTFEDTPKNHKTRILKLSPQTIELLKQWKEDQERQKENCAELWIEEGFVFTTDYGGHMHPDSITAWYNTFSEQRGLPHIHPHAFRHTAATLMLSSGIDITTVAGELGHSKPTTTANVYSHVIDKQRALAAQARGTLLDDMDD